MNRNDWSYSILKLSTFSLVSNTVLFMNSFEQRQNCKVEFIENCRVHKACGSSVRSPLLFKRVLHPDAVFWNVVWPCLCNLLSQSRLYWVLQKYSDVFLDDNKIIQIFAHKFSFNLTDAWNPLLIMFQNSNLSKRSHLWTHSVEGSCGTFWCVTHTLQTGWCSHVE